MFVTASRVQGREDVVFVDEGLIVVADGAGGMGGGREAAEAVVAAARRAVLPDESACVALLREVDGSLAGQTTAVICRFRDDAVWGASVGDSEAWLVEGERLTERQMRKPLLGSGEARPVPFRGALGRSTLLLGSDGLFKYAPAPRIRELALTPDLEQAAELLLQAPRLPSGTWQDDVAVVLLRKGA